MARVSYWATKSCGSGLTGSRPMSEGEARERGWTTVALVEGGPPRKEAADAISEIEMELRVNQGVVPDEGAS